jgi:predicted RNA-binding protein with PIN domain
MGSTPDGWWRDQPGAVRRLAHRLACHQARSGDRIVLVLDVPHPELPEGDNEGELEVHYPRRRGRNAADERIVELLDERPGPTGATTVVTSDRALVEAVRQRGASVIGARSFLDEVEAGGC